MSDVIAQSADPRITLQRFWLDDLRQFKHELAFDPGDSSDFRVFEVGRDDVHGVLKYLLARCVRSLKLNMFGYDDDELDAIIVQKITSEHVFVQGTLDSSQAGGVHEKRILQAWPSGVRSSFAVGRSATGQITHTKGFVVDGTVGVEGSTNWSASGEGTIVAPDGSDAGRKAQNNTLTVFTNPVEVRNFALTLDEQHATALAQQIAGQQKALRKVGVRPPWVVHVPGFTASGGARVYGSFDQSADDQAGVPFTEQVAKELADSINAPPNKGANAEALPLEQIVQPGV